MIRDHCGGCGTPDLEVFLDLGPTPLADKFPTAAGEPEDAYPLRLAVCRSCWLVQLIDVVPDDVLFGQDYGFYTGSSPSAVAYFADYGRWLVDRFADPIRRGVVEIASNDGTLLRQLAPHGPVLGVEPAAGPADAARAGGLDVVGAPFGRTVATEVGKVGLVVANNVAAHVSDLDDFFGGITDVLDDDGVAVLEVQYLPDLLVGNQFDHVYHEHRQYFTVTSLAQTLQRHGLLIRNVLHTEAQGGSIRVTCDKAGTAEKWIGGAQQDRPTGMPTLRSLQSRVDYIRDRLIRLLDTERDSGRAVAGYAASAKSTTLLNYCGIDTRTLQYVEDTTPAKIGRVTPGTHIPIVAPSERDRPDTYLLLAWNYLSGVLRRERQFMADGGRFIVPIPVPVVI